MMPSIFISYRRSDSGGHATRLFDRLRHWYAPSELFLDVGSIGYGVDFPLEIERAVRAARVVLVVIGTDWLETINQRATQAETDFVRREVKISLERRAKGEVELLPVLVAGTHMPSAKELHISLREELGKLFDYNAYEFPSDVRMWDFQFEQLQKELAEVEGMPAPLAQFNLHSGILGLDPSNSKMMQQSVLLDCEVVQRAFGCVSAAVLNWPHEIEGKWIVRPEFDSLYELAKGPNPEVTALIGEPGSGKSAILARLGRKLSAEDVLLLAIKADQLPRSVASVDGLEEWIGSEVPATKALRRLSEDRRVVVLIDQLDALCDLMDQHTERLGSLIRFVDAIRDIQNLFVLVSCREFEFRSDVRLNSLNANEVSLVDPSWEQVSTLLEARGFETSGWSDEVREVLRTPQHLAMFLDHVADIGGELPFISYLGLLGDIVRKRLEVPCGMRTVQAAETIAATMAVEEELWIARSRFEGEFSRELALLEEARFLVPSENGLSIGFRHQTVFDFMRARVFLRHGQTLKQFVMEEKKQSLFVRPTLWSSLNYLRASDKAAYRRQFSELWCRNDLRPHLRFLLVDFLGRVSNPDDQEVAWLLPRLDDAASRARVLKSVAGSRGWFGRLDSRMAGLMTAGPESAWEVTPVLKAASSFDPKKVLSSIRRNWAGDTAYLSCALSVLREIDCWDESDVGFVCELMDHGSGNSFVVQSIAKKVAGSRPDLAPKVLVRYLQARTRLVGEQLEISDDSVLAEVTTTRSPELAQIDQISQRSYIDLIDSNSDWYRIEDLARLCPKEFVIDMWPWLINILSRLKRTESGIMQSYTRLQGRVFLRETSERQPLQRAIEVAIRGYAESEPEDFLLFVHENKNSDLGVIHRLLAMGLERIAKQVPKAVLKYLMEDQRRLMLGDGTNDHAETQALISAILPQLATVEAFELEDAIGRWTCFRVNSGREDADTKRARQRIVRMRRLRLLRVFPVDQLSERGRELVKVEERAFPGLSDEDQRTRIGWIGSPMSSEQMVKATDRQVLALFDDLPDSSGWDHPVRRWSDSVGGSVPASREFADFAVKSPDRALRLIRRFQAGVTERPAGAALVSLSKNSNDPEGLISCVHELDSRGFNSETFRTDAARCLGEVALRVRGLEDRTCKLLESWICKWTSDEHKEINYHRVSGGTDLTEVELAQESDRQSLLWGGERSHVVAQGNYPFLEALRQSYLSREPRAVDEWLGVLERHLCRSEDPSVWKEVAEDLNSLIEADRTRAVGFLDSFYALYPGVFRTITGVTLVAQVMSWIPAKLVNKILNNWISGDWKHGPRAAGEVLALGLCHNPENASMSEQMELVLTGREYSAAIIEEMRAGATSTFAETWSEPALRAMTTRYLLRLVGTANIAVDSAIGAIFRSANPLPADDHTSDLLKALLNRPSALVSGRYSLIECMKGLLRGGWRPDLVYEILKALISEKSNELGDVGTTWASSAGDLAEIALTLHRIPDTRELGLELCERLMKIESYGLNERIARIDRLAFVK